METESVLQSQTDWPPAHQKDSRLRAHSASAIQTGKASVQLLRQKVRSLELIRMEMELL